MAKINIDENQQIAAQLRIQSIPSVFAFKNKQVVNAFQGVIPEKEIVKFLEQSLGDKLDNNFDNFYEEIQKLLNDKNFALAIEEYENATNLIEEWLVRSPADLEAKKLLEEIKSLENS